MENIAVWFLGGLVVGYLIVGPLGVILAEWLHDRSQRAKFDAIEARLQASDRERAKSVRPDA